MGVQDRRGRALRERTLLRDPDAEHVRGRGSRRGQRAPPRRFFLMQAGLRRAGPWVLAGALLDVRRIDWKSDLRARTLNELLAGSVSGEDGIELELGALGALGMEGTRRRVWAMTRRPEKKRFE